MELESHNFMRNLLEFWEDANKIVPKKDFITFQEEIQSNFLDLFKICKHFKEAGGYYEGNSSVFVF